MPQLRCMAYRPQNRAQIYDFFPINEEMNAFYRPFRLFFLEISKLFVKFVDCKMVFEMFGRGNNFLFFILTVLGICLSCHAYSQDEGSLMRAKVMVETGDSLRHSYRFKESVAAYQQALDMTEDTLYSSADSVFRLDVKDRMLMSENGVSMTGFVDIPNVVARHMFSLDDFFLYYPLEDRCWRDVPNQLDSAADHRVARAMFIKDGESTIYWSAEDAEGIRNIYVSSLRDTIWTLPTLLNEQMTSASDEIYPMLSPDGKSLFFSSAGLYGVGGYDIYVSHWDEESNDWGTPVNLGFPYSSPADDFLYIDTEDGKYSFFASTRDCPPDSVWVYVLEFDNVPVRRSVEDPDELREIASLLPYSIHGRGDGHIWTDVPENPETQRYMIKMKEVRALRDSVSYHAEAVAEGADATSLDIFRDSLSRALDRLQQIEMEFLFKGIVIDPEKLMAEAEREIVGEDSGYSFSKRNMGAPLSLMVEVPEVKFDYSFKVLEEAQFAEDQTIPSGVVYQIQMFATKKKASMKDLKGLSPIYEAPGASGHTVYRVGLFRTYPDVLANLNTVKKLGFRGAFIVAFVDGKAVTVAKARALEKEKPQVQQLYEVRMVPSGGELDAAVAAGVRQQAPGKDIARSVGSDGVVTYVVGPFSDKAKAEQLAMFVKAMGVKESYSKVITK